MGKFPVTYDEKLKQHRLMVDGELLVPGVVPVDTTQGKGPNHLQVDADAAIEAEQVGADRLAGGVGHAHLRQAQRVAQRTVDGEVAERVVRSVQHADRLAIHDKPGALDKLTAH